MLIRDSKEPAKQKLRGATKAAATLPASSPPEAEIIVSSGSEPGTPRRTRRLRSRNLAAAARKEVDNRATDAAIVSAMSGAMHTATV